MKARANADALTFDAARSCCAISCLRLSKSAKLTIKICFPILLRAVLVGCLTQQVKDAVAKGYFAPVLSERVPARA